MNVIKPQADHSVCSWLYKTNRIYEGYELSSETFISILHPGLNIPLKLNETLIDSCGVFIFHLRRPSEASLYGKKNRFLPETGKMREGDKACKYNYVQSNNISIEKSYFR